ncbi:MAG: L-aspartate oxidase [Gemmatimonadetes bacterium]|nr:L-aspartate oxidase [Gemmatimonadota bacterium]
MKERVVPLVEKVDVLVLGSGIAGLSYAIKAAAFGHVLLLTKKEDSEANTNYAQGGIAAVMAPGDSFDAHIADTLAAGAGLCHPEAVRLLVESGPMRVRELIDLGVRFTYERGGSDRLSLAREGGHSVRRIVRADDLTGRAIERGLLDAAARAGVEVREHFFARDLWMTGGGHERRCVGVLALDRETGEAVAVQAAVTCLTTGGCGQVYRYTTNPAIATGDGIAMAWRAGAPVANMEFIQFHPTALYPVEDKPFLISEAVRGEGAVLRDRNGLPLMSGRHDGDLAPRDIVARAIDAEMRRAGTDHVWLDCRPIPPERFAERFPNILETCRGRGFDPPAEPLPVVPAAHYLCGGVRTDLDARTGIGGLLAAGEVTCTGVHGANRLASNSLLEAVVFAHRAAATTREMLEKPVPASEGPPALSITEEPRRDLAAIRTEVRRILWDGAGIVRDDAGLLSAEERLQDLVAGIPSQPVGPETAEVANMLLVGSLIVACAISRRESRGLHFTRSHPDRDPAFERDTVLVPPATPGRLARDREES